MVFDKMCLRFLHVVVCVYVGFNNMLCFYKLTNYHWMLPIRSCRNSSTCVHIDETVRSDKNRTSSVIRFVCGCVPVCV